MEAAQEMQSLADWFVAHGLCDITPLAKEGTGTRAWLASVSGQQIFLKLYPPAFSAWAEAEAAIAGQDLHPAIVSLRQKVACQEGTLLLYDQVLGENLGPMAVRSRFQKLPLSERVAVVRAVSECLAAVSDAGFMIVDWYEGNMIYDFASKQIWLFDWDLCRKGTGFTLEMDANYGSSRLMAPEEFVRGSWLDQQTIVFNLGRYALLTLPELAEPLAPVLSQATYPARSQRYASVQELMNALADAGLRN